ncbi:MAG: hypothetical protein ACI89L_000297 [Phycisphaerales bacterium]|jgi:hypothetical protein
MLLLALLPLAALAQPAPPPSNPPSAADAARRERAQARIDRANAQANPDAVAEPEINPLGKLPEIDPARVQKFDELTNALAAPEMAGRFPNTPGIELAATLIETEFTALGLTPLFPSTTALEDGTEVLTPRDTFRQPLDRGEEVTVSTGKLAVATTDNGPGFAPARGSTHAVVSYSGTGTFTGPLVFCGYAVTAGPGDYLNFPVNTDLAGKVAVILTHEPMNDQGESLWSNAGWSLSSSVPAKISAVTRRGAKAVLVVRPPVLEDNSLEPDEKPIETLRYDDIPILMLSAPMARSLLTRADPEGRTLDQLIALANAAPTLLDLDALTVTVTTQITRTPKRTHNIGALLPGVGPLANEYVVVGAHYDHVGNGDIGSSTPGLIHPGADDNASGTANMLIVAQTLAEAYAELGEGDSTRSIVFLAFTAEESGLEGSRLFVTKPPFPIDSVTLMLNLDMVGRMRDGLLELGGLHSAPELEEFVNPHLADSGLRVRRGSSIGDNRSDHASFDAKKVPNLFFFTGLHDEYHTPDDTPDLLNDEGAVRIADLVASIALDAATTETTLTHARARARRAIGAPVMPRVRVGIVPGPHPDGGLSVRQVSPDTSASAAGLLPYDRIIKWNGKPLNTLDEFGVLLTEHGPGDVVTLTIIRDDEEIEVEMTLNTPG